MSEIRTYGPELDAYLRDLFKAVGIGRAQGASVARNMTWSELVGRKNFGVIRIPVHVKRIEHGVLNAIPKPKFSQTAVGTGILDGDNGFGYFTGELAMERAVKLAAEAGIGMVAVNNSNFFGTGAYFADLAARKGMLSLVMSNSFPKVVAHGGLKSVLGTNPFAFGAPRAEGNNLLVDFATSSLAGSTVRQYLDQGKQLPEGLAIGPDGEPETDPEKIGKASLMPFGGAKGYGLSLMVEILSGILSGAGFSNSVNSTYSNFKEKSNSGHCMIAIDIEKFMPLEEYYGRFESLVGILKLSNPENEVLLPGEVRWKSYEYNSEHGITIPEKIIADLTAISDKYKIECPWLVAG